MMKSMGQVFAFERELTEIERDMGIFLLCYGTFMAYVALNLSTSQWTFFKTIGFYIISFIFFIVEFVILKIKIKKVRK